MAQFDNWPPLQDFTFQKFNFHSHKYEMWEAGRMIRSGEVHCNIKYICNGGIYNRTSIDVKIVGNPFPQTLMSSLEFDRAICLGDRILFYISAAHTNVQNTTLAMLASVIGYTRESKEYDDNEPVVASVFTIKQTVVKVSFSLANPDRLIEFF